MRTIDEAAYYNYALGADRVSNHYLTGVGAVPEPTTGLLLRLGLLGVAVTRHVWRKPVLLVGLFALVASGSALAQPAQPDLSVHTTSISFVSKDGVVSSFTEAEIGDVVNTTMRISNAAGAGTANNVTGHVAIELGYTRIILGTFSIPEINPGENLAVTLIPNASLPNPPLVLADTGNGELGFQWTVAAPAPWLHVFFIEIESSNPIDSSPFDNLAGKSLTVFAATPDLPGIPVLPALAGLSVLSNDISFVSKNGIAGSFTEASVGDELAIAISISNAAGASTANNVAGHVRIGLGYDRIDLGTFFVPEINPGENLALTLVPNASLPTPPIALADAGNGEPGFKWTVTLPTPWLHVLECEIDSSVPQDASPLDNAAGRSVLVGSFPPPSGGCDLTIIEPFAETPWSVEVPEGLVLRISSSAGVLLEPSDIERMTAFFIRSDGSGAHVAAPLDFSGDSPHYLGEGTFGGAELVTIPASEGGQSIVIRLMAVLHSGTSCASEMAVQINPVSLGSPETAIYTATGILSADSEMLIEVGDVLDLHGATLTVRTVANRSDAPVSTWSLAGLTGGGWLLNTSYSFTNRPSGAPDLLLTSLMSFLAYNRFAPEISPDSFGFDSGSEATIAGEQVSLPGAGVLFNDQGFFESSGPPSLPDFDASDVATLLDGELQNDLSIVYAYNLTSFTNVTGSIGTPSVAVPLAPTSGAILLFALLMGSGIWKANRISRRMGSR